MTYSQRLRDPRWQKKRLQILERDGWRCLSCGETTKPLNVHHIVYVRGKDPWGYEDRNYQTLCEECHETRGDIAEVAANQVRAAMANLSSQDMIQLSLRLTQFLFGNGGGK